MGLHILLFFFFQKMFQRMKELRIKPRFVFVNLPRQIKQSKLSISPVHLEKHFNHWEPYADRELLNYGIAQQTNIDIRPWFMFDCRCARIPAFHSHHLYIRVDTQSYIYMQTYALKTASQKSRWLMMHDFWQNDNNKRSSWETLHPHFLFILFSDLWLKCRFQLF